MSAYRRKSKLYSKLNSGSMSLRSNTPEEGFRFKRDLPEIDWRSKWSAKESVAKYPQLDIDEQTYRAYHAAHPMMPKEIEIGSPAPSMQKAVNLWHGIRNWVVYYRHHPEELRG